MSTQEMGLTIYKPEAKMKVADFRDHMEFLVKHGDVENETQAVACGLETGVGVVTAIKAFYKHARPEDNNSQHKRRVNEYLSSDGVQSQMRAACHLFIDRQFDQNRSVDKFTETARTGAIKFANLFKVTSKKNPEKELADAIQKVREEEREKQKALLIAAGVDSGKIAELLG